MVIIIIMQTRTFPKAVLLLCMAYDLKILNFLSLFCYCISELTKAKKFLSLTQGFLKALVQEISSSQLMYLVLLNGFVTSIKVFYAFFLLTFKVNYTDISVSYILVNTHVTQVSLSSNITLLHSKDLMKNYIN